MIGESMYTKDLYYSCQGIPIYRSVSIQSVFFHQSLWHYKTIKTHFFILRVQYDSIVLMQLMQLMIYTICLSCANIVCNSLEIRSIQTSSNN